MTKAPIELIWSSLPIPALLINPEDVITEANPAAEGFFNTSGRSLCGKFIWDRLLVSTPLEESFARAKEFSTPLFVNDVEVGAAGQSQLQCNLTFAPVVQSPGNVIILIAPRELAGRVNQTNSVKSAAKSAIGMAEMLAHEIKNPLAGISGAAQLLSMNLENKDLELTDLIVEETRRIVKLLEQVEEFGNYRKLEMKAVNIHDILGRAKRSAQLGFGAHIKFEEEYDPSLPAAKANSDQLLQVVLNLIKNASEACGNNGKIKLQTSFDHSFRLRRSDGTGEALPLQIKICDNGPGLPFEIKGEVFDPFVSGKENGTGLGLALASKIISDHGGWISVDSVPGNTVFTISLAAMNNKNNSLRHEVS
jgi:two-component system nitrogen regulation sensor histidine kinase GlnL